MPLTSFSLLTIQLFREFIYIPLKATLEIYQIKIKYALELVPTFIV